jgi:hypothetical protein
MKATVLQWTARSAALALRFLHTLKTYIPTHIQALTWFDVDESGKYHSFSIFETMNPHWCWISQWDDGSKDPIVLHPFTTFPTHGYFLWVIWDSTLGRRRYICLRASECKDIFYDFEHINDLFALQDRAILKRIQSYTTMDSRHHRKNHKLLDIAIQSPTATISILKTLLNHELEDSLYIPKNLTGGALLWVYHSITQTFPKSASAASEATAFPADTTLLLTDYEMEERNLKLNEFVFA